MRSSQTITLFTQRPEPSPGPISFVFSALVHGGVVGLLSLGILYTPQVKDRIVPVPFSIRQLDLHSPERQSANGNFYPGPRPTARTHAAGGQAAAPPRIPRELAQRTPAPQTLVQPDLPPNLLLPQEIPVPAVLLWSAQKSAAKKIVPPSPHEATAADAQPSLDPPNEETKLADTALSSSETAIEPQPLTPSTNTPVVVHGPALPQEPPETTSKSDEKPTPAAAMSLSDLHMPEGTITLPPANETAAADAADPLSPGKSGKSSPAGSGDTAGKNSRSGAERSTDDAEKEPGSAGTATALDTPKAAAPPGTGAGNGNALSANRITLPKNGQFGAVVVGSSMEEQFPETAGLWSGRLAYTVYLHVGLAKSWILQYSLARADDAAEAGSIARLEAPWPYNIVRPNLSSDVVNADALMVHGFVNEAGRFEALTIAFPLDFAQAQFVLDALAQWQFRPAMQNGRVAKVEVLLIIPEDAE
ncbi:MAG: hypothetical protein ABSE99_00110 [Terracidiphilus sp.]|jgi:hypothetical protein